MAFLDQFRVKGHTWGADPTQILFNLFNLELLYVRGVWIKAQKTIRIPLAFSKEEVGFDFHNSEFFIILVLKNNPNM